MHVESVNVKGMVADGDDITRLVQGHVMSWHDITRLVQGHVMSCLVQGAPALCRMLGPVVVAWLVPSTHCSPLLLTSPRMHDTAPLMHPVSP